MNIKTNKTYEKRVENIQELLSEILEKEEVKKR